jgi:hypothetical protein
MPGRNWLLKTLRVDHQIAHSDLTAIPKKKMKHYKYLPLQIEMIPRFHDHDKGAVIEGYGGLARLLSWSRSGQ